MSTATDLKPALAPPPGVTPNFIDPPSQGYVTVVVMVFVLSLTTPIVLARLYTRHFINRRLWWDDYTAIIAWIGLFGFAGILFETLKYGNGVDMWNIPAARGAHFSRLWGDLEIIARVSMTFTKVSILLLFLRIFVPPRTPKNTIYYVIWFVIWFNVLYCIALVLTVLLQCVGQPKSKAAKHTCIKTYYLVISASTINAISDIVMLIIPLVAVWDLHMPIQRKLALSVVFAVGMLAIAASIARLGWQIRRARDPNQTIVLIKIALLAVAEQTVGIIVGCMPVLPALFRHIRHIRQQRSESRESKSHSEGWRGELGGSTLKPSKGGSNDSYPLSREYREVNDLESGHKTAIEIRGTTPTTDGESYDKPSNSMQTVGGLQGSPDTAVLVSRSIQVESHPREPEGNRILPQPVHNQNYYGTQRK